MTLTNDATSHVHLKRSWTRPILTNHTSPRPYRRPENHAYVAQGVVTAAIVQSVKPGADPATVQLNTVEVNFLFVPGNSGGPIFDAETGRVYAFVHGYRDSEIVQRFVGTNPQNVSAGAPAQHVQALHAIYSVGIKLDAIRPELERFGATL